MKVVKLDIDNNPIEMAFMEAVDADEELQARIGELFFAALLAQGHESPP